jgi:Protein of unknown function (DUF3616)
MHYSYLLLAAGVAVSPIGAAVAQTLVAAKTEPVVHYNGICEASAAAKLDATHFVVASDDSALLRIYEHGKSAPIIPNFDVEKATGEGVTDIEAAARIGDTIFWLTSHSFSKAKPDKPALSPVGRVYNDFRDKVLMALGADGKGIEPKLDIEGLAATPDNALLVGLRSPLQGTSAYVVRIGNPFPLLGLPQPGGVTGKPSRDAHYVLPLGGRGIRSIERVGRGAHSYLIVAGASGEDQNAPTLFWWDGAGNAVTELPKASLAEMAPEAMIAWSEREVEIFADNERVGDKECKDTDEAQPADSWFPGITVHF